MVKVRARVLKQYIIVSVFSLLVLTSIFKPISAVTVKSKSAVAKSQQVLRKINLAWVPVNKFTVNNAIYSNGGNVLSPTWFELDGFQGKIQGNPLKAYIDRAHKNKQKVWALISNKFDIELTHKFLKNVAGRGIAIKNIINIYKKNNIDGVNVDFEKMYEADKKLYTQFINELSIQTKKNKLTLSVDVTPVSNSAVWSKCYERNELSKYVDYVMIMTYDQHIKGTSPGSVAEISWVENSIKNILKARVANNKLVLGVPFYTRVWSETKTSKNKIITDCRAISMDEAAKMISQNKAKVTWDKNAGQNYAEYIKKTSVGVIKYKIWIENAKSISLRTTLINKYKLVGVAAWRKGFETKDVWKVISKNLGV
jgi:spore germination protein YaaH